MQRYKTWRSHADPEKRLHLLVFADAPEGPETNWNTFVPPMLRSLGPWVSGPGGECASLKRFYREALQAHGFMVLNCRPTLTNLEDEPECSAQPCETVAKKDPPGKPG